MEWQPIPGWPYEVSDTGRVRRTAPGAKTWPGRERKLHKCGNGYPFVTFKVGKRAQPFLVHRLVACAFIGPPPSPKHEVNHINGDKEDNRAENLEWVTSSENKKHAFKNGLRPTAEDHPWSKITPGIVRQIRSIRRHTGLSQERIGDMVGLSQTHVGRILRGDAWGHVQ